MEELIKIECVADSTDFADMQQTFYTDHRQNIRFICKAYPSIFVGYSQYLLFSLIQHLSRFLQTVKMVNSPRNFTEVNLYISEELNKFFQFETLFHAEQRTHFPEISICGCYIQMVIFLDSENV